MIEGQAQEPPPAGVVRATDADRYEVVAKLKRALDLGALEFDEIETRLEAVYAARTRGDLEGLTQDLALEASTPLTTRPRNAALDDGSFRMHLIVYVLVISMLVGIWALAGAGHFWPFYPAAGWGIGIGVHFAAVTEASRRREQRQGSRRRAVESVEPHQVARRVLPSGNSRAFVAAMFADIVGSTGLNEAMGDEAWSRERARFRAVVQRCAAAEGGWEVNAAGDGVLVRFDAPAAAVRAAAALQREMASQRTTSFAPTVSIGIHSGDVIDEGDDIVGSVINMAARVGDIAGPDEIVVTEHVADHVDDLVTSDRGLHELRGISRPRHLLLVDWTTDQS